MKQYKIKLTYIDNGEWRWFSDIVYKEDELHYARETIERYYKTQNTDNNRYSIVENFLKDEWLVSVYAIEGRSYILSISPMLYAA